MRATLSSTHHAADYRGHRGTHPQRIEGDPAAGGTLARPGRLTAPGRGAEPAPGRVRARLSGVGVGADACPRGSLRPGGGSRDPRSGRALSYSVDVNVLRYASDESSHRHVAARRFVEGRAADSELFCLAWPTLMAYLRIATHPRIFSRPLSPEQALGNVTALLGLPRVRPLAEADGFLDVYREVAGRLPVRGSLVPDAHLAALLRQHGVRRLYTSDVDFRRFDFLDVRDPFA